MAICHRRRRSRGCSCGSESGCTRHDQRRRVDLVNGRMSIGPWFGLGGEPVGTGPAFLSRAWLAVLLVVGLGRAAGAAVLHVRADASPSIADGLAWATAYPDLGDALAAAHPGDEIWIAAGTYRPAPSDGPRDATFLVPSGIALYGGFAGDEGTRDARNPGRHASVLSGDLRDDDGTRAPPPTDDNVDHVITVEIAFEPVVLDGLVVTGGTAGVDANEWLPGHGGAVRAIVADLIVRNTVLASNAADLGGAAIWCFAGRLEMDGCVVASSDGGGIDVTAASAVVVRACVFRDNERSVAGAARIVGVGDVRIEDSLFLRNASQGGAGAILLLDAGTATIARCDFESNHTDGAGGALFAEGDGAVTVSRCAFVDNEATLLGGAVAAGQDASFTSCLIAANVSGGGHGAVYAAGRVSFVNTTIVDNVGSGIVVTPGKPGLDVTVTSSILWGNAPYAVGAFGGGPYAGATVVASDVEGGWAGPGAGNLSVDPVFVDPGAGDWRLDPASPCIDAGWTRALPAGATLDLLGAPRVAGVGVDLGAYEHPAGVSSASPFASYAARGP